LNDSRSNISQSTASIAANPNAAGRAIHAPAAVKKLASYVAQALLISAQMTRPHAVDCIG
jgi:hypothetical protein